MSNIPDESHGLAELLARLDTMSARTDMKNVYTGFAAGRTQDSLHLAIESGVIAIPLSEIQEVAPASHTNVLAVHVAVRDPSTVKQIRRAKLRPELTPNPDDPTIPLRDPFGLLSKKGFLPWQLLNPAAEANPTYTAGDGTETLSVSGGVADDCEDYVRARVYDGDDGSDLVGRSR